MEFKCPHCGSDDVRKVSLMYEQATSNLNYREVGLRSDGVGTYAAGSGGIQNLMGGRIAPPDAPVRPRSRTSFIAVVMSGVFLYMIVQTLVSNYEAHTPTPRGLYDLLIILLLLSLFIFLKLTLGASLAFRKELSVYEGSLPGYQTRYEEWTRKWMCLRCGESFDA